MLREHFYRGDMGRTTVLEDHGYRQVDVMELATEDIQSATPKTTTGKPSFYRPELDALRFFAFFSVFLFHVLPDHVSRLSFIPNPVTRDIIVCITASLSFGVCLFFVLSAYLITTLLLREHRTSNKINLREFYIRRILRIWPLYLAVISVAFVACTVFRGFPGSKLLAAYVFFSGNLLWNLHLPDKIGPLAVGHLWSVSVEEQFYLIFPGLARVTRMRFLYSLCALVTGVAVCSLAYFSHAGIRKDDVWRSSLVQFMMFSAGIAIAAYFRNRPLPRFSVLARAIILLLGVASCFCAQYFCRVSDDRPFAAAQSAIAGYVLVMLGCSALLLAFLGFSAKLPPALTYLGKISYGLYVFHPWAITFAAYFVALYLHIPFEQGTGGGHWAAVKILLAGVMTLGMAMASYHFLEKPFLKMKKRFEVVSTRAV
jgi:peptidoglycan/LPS O-acetylase OafA/YrhL